MAAVIGPQLLFGPEEVEAMTEAEREEAGLWTLDFGASKGQKGNIGKGLCLKNADGESKSSALVSDVGT